MDSSATSSQRAWAAYPIFLVVAAAAIYSIYYFVLCQMPLAGIPTFRIDYFATTITRASDSLSRSLLHARPVSELYIYLQAIVAKAWLHGQSRFIIYPVQHIAELLYFLCVAKAIESIFRRKLGGVAFIVAWLLFITNPGVIGDVYKLETIVGTLSCLFGGIALVILGKWDRDRKLSSAIWFIVLFALSIFSKEDFIIPPVCLLLWYIVRDGNWMAQLRKHWLILLTVFMLLAFFLLFNMYMIPGRSYMDPVDKGNSPYFMTLDPRELAKVMYYYSFGVGLHIRLMTMLYIAVSLISLIFRRHWRETVMIGMIVCGLMAPYLIMPNHLFSYYGLNWWAWESLASAALIQILLPRAGLSVNVLLGVAIMTPNLTGLYRHHSINWNQSNYLRTNFSISANIRKTLLANRDALNRYPQVAVIGIGPGQIEQSPWQSNGETAFYLRNDLELNSRWMLFVKSSDPAYRAEPEKTPASGWGGLVAVRDLGKLKNHGNLPRLIFDKDGNGRLIAPATVSKLR